MASVPKAGETAPPVAEDRELEGIRQAIEVLAKGPKPRTNAAAAGPATAAPQVPADKTKFFKWVVFGLIFLCGVGVVLFSGSKTLQLVFIVLAGCLFIAEPYLQWYLVVKLKFLQRPEFLETMLKVAILVAVLFVGDQNLQIIILIAAAAFFIVTPTIPDLLKKLAGNKTDKATGKPKQISSAKWVIAFAAAVANDVVLDYLLAIGLVPGIGDVFDAVTDAIIWWCLGPGYMLPCGIEFVPGVDIVPTYILVVGFAFYNERRKEKAASGAAGGAAGAAGKPAHRHELSRVTLGFLIIVIVIIILGLVIAPAFLKGGTGIVSRILEGAAKGVVSSGAWLKENNPITLVGNWFEKRIAIATGSYYEGEVEDNQDTKLGVYLEDIMPADPQYWEDEEVIMWGTVRAFTLDEPIKVNVSCTADGIAADSITPASEFSIYTLEDKFMECKFSKDTVLNKLKNGAKNLRFNADYNFKTLSYLKTYFMDLDRLRSMRRQQIDPLQEFGITDKYPIAVFTNGPLKIGMETTKELPIGVPSGDAAALREIAIIGITLENRWKGRVTKITKLELQLPDSLDLNHCDRPFTTGTPADEAGYKKYSLDFSKMDARQTEKLENITTYQNMKCWIDVTDRQKLLGTDPIATKYIRLTAEYNYQSYETSTVFIKKVERGSTVSTATSYAKGCCQTKLNECARVENDCDSTSWLPNNFCSAADSGQQGKCISCKDVCNTESQCTGTKTKLVDYGWCCDAACTSGSLLNVCSLPADGKDLDVTSSSQCLSDDKIKSILTKANSPAKADYAAFNKYGNMYGIRSDVALAFFKQESTYGTTGIATETKSMGNIKYSTSCPGTKYTSSNGNEWCAYDGWDAGIRNWYEVISKNYVNGGFNTRTVESILQHYCPPSDCDTSGYIRNVRQYVTEYQTT